VEREAPPLLGYIPRYLGVMLVSYRRVPKPPSSPSPSDSPGESPRRPPIRKAATDTPRPSNKVPALHTSGQETLPEEGPGGDTETDEAEMPEVVLDRNRHIIPEWMLRGRNRSLSHSSASVSPNRQLKRAHLNGGTASSPDLGTPFPPAGASLAKSSPLARYPPFVSIEMAAPTPANSPNQPSLPFPIELAENPAARRFRSRAVSDEEGSLVRSRFVSENASRAPVPQSPWFGGTGSTMVNTKWWSMGRLANGG